MPLELTLIIPTEPVVDVSALARGGAEIERPAAPGTRITRSGGDRASSGLYDMAVISEHHDTPHVAYVNREDGHIPIAVNLDLLAHQAYHLRGIVDNETLHDFRYLVTHTPQDESAIDIWRSLFFHVKAAITCSNHSQVLDPSVTSEDLLDVSRREAAIDVFQRHFPPELMYHLGQSPADEMLLSDVMFGYRQDAEEARNAITFPASHRLTGRPIPAAGRPPQSP